jgi:nucleotidyltransferase AbiEii toxin of type IV toxin-antitoxin system
LPRLLEGELIVRGYPVEMVLAEKIVTAIARGSANTLWHDFVDIYALIQRHNSDGKTLRESLLRVAEYRQVTPASLRMPLPAMLPLDSSRPAKPMCYSSFDLLRKRLIVRLINNAKSRTLVSITQRQCHDFAHDLRRLIGRHSLGPEQFCYPPPDYTHSGLIEDVYSCELAANPLRAILA